MAEYHSHLFDKASGSVGNVTLCNYKGKNVAKGKICFKNKKQTPAQLVQQTRFKALSDLAYHFHRAIWAGFRGQSYSSGRAAFIGMNQNAVEVDEETFDVTVHLDRVTCTTGNLTPPAVKVTIREKERVARAEWSRQPLSPIAKDEDDLFLVLYDTEKQDSVAYPLGKRGMPDATEVTLHKDFSPANVIAYAFALSPVNTRASVSVFTDVKRE